MEFFDGMAQKTKNISEIMKLTAAVSSEKERQEKIYRELGETYYKVYGDRAESELMEMCTQIRESKETVENYEKEILALKGIVVCPACGYEVSIHFNFCNNCGHKMKEIQEEQPSVDELIQEEEELREEEKLLAEKEEEAVEEDRIVKEILEEEASAAKESVEEILAEEQQSEEEVEPISTEEPLELENEDPFVPGTSGGGEHILRESMQRMWSAYGRRSGVLYYVRYEIWRRESGEGSGKRRRTSRKNLSELRKYCKTGPSFLHGMWNEAIRDEEGIREDEEMSEVRCGI